MIPASVQNFLSDELNLSIRKIRSLSGGSINQAAKISADERDFFLKWNHSAPADFFIMEADGLKTLKDARSSLRVPGVILVGKPDGEQPGFLLLEFIDGERSGDSFAFGAGLARLHQNEAEQFGFHSDNYIGSLPQSNHWHKNWISFFSEERIGPQLKMAIDSGKLNSSIFKNWGRLTGRLDELLPPCKPSLLHGDLWGGNYLFDTSGIAALIDPAVYYGHPEMDLAFTKMFGGFSPDFYEGYKSVSPSEPGLTERVPIYNLYPLLVHVNLFGGHYTNQCKDLLLKF